MECVLEAKKWPKSIPVITDKGVARMVAASLIQSSFFHRSEKVEDKKGYLKVSCVTKRRWHFNKWLWHHSSFLLILFYLTSFLSCTPLQISQRNVFEETGYYTWMYSGNMVWSNVATGLVIAIVIICTLMPIWPAAAKHVLWYFSVTFLIIIFVLLMMRMLSFLFMWLLGYEFWVFPRLFDESLSFQDSFVPIYSFEPGTPGQGYYRLGAVAALIGFVYWACTQPTEFDGFMKAQKDFIDDLYSGNLLSDVAHTPAAHLDRNKRVPSLEDLLKAMEADEKEKIGGTEGEGSASGSGSEEVLSEEVRAMMDGEWVHVEGDESSSGAAGSSNGKKQEEKSSKEASDSNENNSDSEDGNTDAEEEWSAPEDYDEKEEDHHQQQQQHQEHDEM